MKIARLESLLSGLGAVKVACIGDLMVDRYVYGEVTRVSPEAPIPVLSRRSEAMMLGAVGNVARNIAALGAQAGLAALVGDDAPAAAAVELIAAEPLITSALVTVTGRQTTEKTRFVAQGQQLLRLDSEEATPPEGDTLSRMLKAAETTLDGCRAVILSDYAKGVVTEALARAVVSSAARRGVPVIVDPKGRSFAKYGPVDLIKPNARELAIVTDLPTGSDAEVERALVRALADCEARAILVTRAGSGMSLAVRDQPVRHFAGRARAVFDVSGAGDTSIAALAVALAGGATLDEAVIFAILASGVVVGKVGTATVSPQELVEAEVAQTHAAIDAKLVPVARVAEIAQNWRDKGLSVGFTNGCFDILHRGHVTYLEQARQWCDRLVVAINSDASVYRLKGEGRPVNTLDSRALVLAGLSSVDLVTTFDADTPIDLIRAIRPDVLVKGSDYAVSEVVGAEDVIGWGGRVQLADIVEGYSTTAAIDRMTGARS